MFNFAIVGVLLSAQALDFIDSEQRCYAPNEDGACSLCKRGMFGCMRSNAVYTCSPNLESCCRSTDMADLGVEYEHCYTASGGHDQVCPRALINGSRLDNDFCVEFCNKVGRHEATRHEFESSCHIEHFDINYGQVQLWSTGKFNSRCFDNWVHGYADGVENAGFVTIRNVETPSRCQTLCQHNDACKSFVWQAIDEPSGTKAGQCTFKNQTHVDEAMKVVYNGSQEVGAYDAKYCDVEKALKCWNDPEKCTYCKRESTKKCRWRSEKHVAGWKYCYAGPTCPEEYTTPSPPPTTTTAESTTTTTPEPTTTTPEPTTTTPEPTTTTPEPTTTTPEPTTTTPEPTTTDKPTECPTTSQECPTTSDDCHTKTSDCHSTRPPCDNCEHGIDMKIHEKPKLLRLAIDN